MDANKWFESKRAMGTLIFIFVLVASVSGCIGATEAASELSGQPAGDQLAVAGEGVAQQGNAVLRFVPDPAQLTVGGVGTVQLYLEGVDNLYGLEAHLTFDKNILQVQDDDPDRDGVQVAVGEIPYPDFIVQNMVDNFGGRLDYAVVQLSPREPASGSGVVATIHFLAVQAGSSTIGVAHAKLASPDGFEIPVTWQEGTVVVSDVTGPTATPEPSATPGPIVTPEPSATPGPTASPGPTATSPPTVTSPPGMTPTPTPAVAEGCPYLYVVRSGDTAFSIARRFGIALENLVAANQLPATFDVKIGQLLVIPGVAGPSRTTHVVQVGETLYSIARRYGTSVETLAAINQIVHPWHVSVGQTLLVCPAK